MKTKCTVKFTVKKANGEPIVGVLVNIAETTPLIEGKPFPTEVGTASTDKNGKGQKVITLKEGLHYLIRVSPKTARQAIELGIDPAFNNGASVWYPISLVGGVMAVTFTLSNGKWS
jgi:hypothetical protein